MTSMQFGLFTVGDVTPDPTNGTVQTEHERIKAQVEIARLGYMDYAVIRPDTIFSINRPRDEDIYEKARDAVAWTKSEYGDDAALAFHLSPGTPAMAVIWILLGTLTVAPGARIELAEGAVLRVLGDVVAPATQIFLGPGTVDLTSSRVQAARPSCCAAPLRLRVHG